MRPSYIACVPLIILTLPAIAQTAVGKQSEADRRREIMSEAKRAETRALLEVGRKRQEVENAKTSKLWERWTYAVCIGCGLAEPKYIRIVHTTPARVLAGIPAAEDDAREKLIARQNHRSRKASLTRRAAIKIADAARKALA